MSLLLLFSFLSFFFLSFLFFSFFYLREYLSPLIHLRFMKQIFSVSFFPFLNIYIYIYIQYLGRVEGKTVLSCAYLFEGFTSLVAFFTDEWHPPSESAGSAFLVTTVQTFCSMLFTGHSPGAAVNRCLYPSTSVLKTKDPLPNFLLMKRHYFWHERLWPII